jgi:hypothetical protein|eukprot:Tamp_22253.p1 GENE.Tamp_22253~~Tamp_22253.p1  ORF type:complete len:246 (+),score=48.53 Tamp_22253:270-1007(+)
MRCAAGSAVSACRVVAAHADGARDHEDPDEPATVDAQDNPVASECGQTHVCVCNADGEAVWAQPIDVHYVTTSLRGWPSLIVEVWAQDSGGRNEIAGYGVAHVPCAAGHYELEVPLWRPVDLKTSHTRLLGDIPGYIGQSLVGLGRAARGAFLGIWPRLHNDLNPDGVCEMTNAKKLIYHPQDHTQDRKRLRTVGTGLVKAKLSVITRGFSKLGPGVNRQVEAEWEEEQRRKAQEKEDAKRVVHM